MTRRLRWVPIWLSLLALLACVSTASAATFRPLLAASPFTPLAGASVACVNGGVPCYLPAEIHRAYDYPSGPDAPDGTGQTIVVVTAYGAPFVGDDLETFARLTGVPVPPNLTVLTQQTPVADARGTGQTYFWQVETDLDVQWAYATAPRAHIVLAVANTDDTLDVAQVMREVLPRYPGAIVTQSFGMDETGPASDPNLARTFSPMYLGVVQGGGTAVAASGDLGASDGTELEAALAPELGVIPSAMAAYPASDPAVLAVGGTEGDPYPDGLLTDAGVYGGEQAWNEVAPSGQPGAGGGAPSAVFAAPSWQRSLKTRARLEPDVSYNASFVDGALVILSCRPAGDGTVTHCDPTQQGYVAVGGTSAGAPQWAGIVALANELRRSELKPPLGLVAPVLYELARNPVTYARDFHDVTAGTNALDLGILGTPGSSPFGFAAAPGYDLATGLGTPRVSSLLDDLATRGPGGTPGDLLKPVPPPAAGHGRRPHFDPSR